MMRCAVFPSYKKSLAAFVRHPRPLGLAVCPGRRRRGILRGDCEEIEMEAKGVAVLLVLCLLLSGATAVDYCPPCWHDCRAEQHNWFYCFVVCAALCTPTGAWREIHAWTDGNPGVVKG